MFAFRSKGLIDLGNSFTKIILNNKHKLLIHTSVVKNKKSFFPEPEHWPEYNDKIFPVQTLQEPRRPGYVCHHKANIKYSPKKMWYVACFVRGMSVDEALRQLQFVPKKGALIVRDAILEAQELAVNEHNFEFKSNMWVAESFANKGFSINGYRRHAKGRVGVITYKYCHYFVRLEEGQPPPKDKYYYQEPKDGESLLQDWLSMMRRRKIISSL